MKRLGRALTLVACLALLAAPAVADAKRRPGTPKQATVVRAISKVVASTSFASGKAAAGRARAAFRRKRYCRASDALAAHHRQVVARLKRAERRRARREVRRLLTLDGRGAKARGLVLRSLPAGKACGGPPSVGVDRAVKPQQKLPGNRPVARVVDAYGNGVDFAANELIVEGTDAEVRALVRRWRGRILSEVDFSRIGGKGKQFLVRITTSRADESRLTADIAALTKARGGALTVSSDQGLALLAAAGREARRGGDVGVNVVQQGATIATGTSLEGGDGDGGFSMTPGLDYTSNAFQWKHMSAASTQGVGTAEAWQLIKRSGRDANKIGLAVLDMGFAPQTNGVSEFGQPLEAISNVPFVDALGTANLSNCGGPCPWHGTNVANAAFATPDNGLGVAGTGGIVADRIVVFTFYDYFTSIAAVVEAGVAGAKVLNMSYGAGVPAVLSWTALPFEAATLIANRAGLVLMAAAGNDDTNVDAEDCFIVCWEETLHTPCENTGVFCVGALGHDSVGKAGYSNFGNRGGGVDLFAPGTVLVGLDPARVTGVGRPAIHAVNGTSFASPYLAGVAALVFAANPRLSAGAVERTLVDTAKTSSDSKVRRYVNALAAVESALPPLLNIEAPQDGDTIQRGGNIIFKAFAHEGDANATRWTLPDGTLLGTGAEIATSALPYGNVTVTATTGALRDTVRINVGNTAPTVQILQPGDGSSFVQNETVQFSGLSGDVNQLESEYRLRDDQIRWFMDGSTTPFGTGHSTSLAMSGVPVGTHTVTMRGTDDAGVSADRSISITVGPPAANPPPSVTITSPPNGQSKNAVGPDATGYYAFFDFQSTVSDPNGDPLTFKWEETVINPVDPAPDTPVTRFTVEDPGNQKVYWTSCNEQGHDFKLTVSDGTNTRSATVRIYVSVVC